MGSRSRSRFSQCNRAVLRLRPAPALRRCRRGSSRTVRNATANRWGIRRSCSSIEKHAAARTGVCDSTHRKGAHHSRRCRRRQSLHRGLCFGQLRDTRLWHDVLRRRGGTAHTMLDYRRGHQRFLAALGRHRERLKYLRWFHQRRTNPVIRRQSQEFRRYQPWFVRRVPRIFCHTGLGLLQR